MSSDPERHRSLTADALESLLARLGGDRESAAQDYDAIRRKLVGFFERRNAPGPEALADETIDRVARRLDEGESVEYLRAYFYGVAKRVMMESARRRFHQETAERQMAAVAAPFAAPDADERDDPAFSCLERCLNELPPESRELIVAYYQAGPAERRRLAARLAMTYTGLKSQAHRIRVRLGTCVERCLDPQRGPRRRNQ
jgi:RNA polymerase sigma factor (sigma-70 family)